LKESFPQNDKVFHKTLGAMRKMLLYSKLVDISVFGSLWITSSFLYS